MKQKARGKRLRPRAWFFVMVLSLAMMLGAVLGLLPALEVKAAAAPEFSLGTVVHVSSMDQLKEYLNSFDEYTIVLDRDLSKREDVSVQYWCVINGSKVLDLNGHSLTLENVNRVNSYLFHVPEGCQLIINDSAHSKDRDDVEIFYNGRIHTADEAHAYERNIFSVAGTLIQNGGYIRAGRWKEVYFENYWYYKKVVWGSGVTVLGGGTFVMNDGWIRGEGKPDATYVTGALINSGDAYINNGHLEGQCGGYAIRNRSDHATLRIVSGTLETHGLKDIANYSNTTFAPFKQWASMVFLAVSPNVYGTDTYSGDEWDQYLSVTPSIDNLKVKMDDSALCIVYGKEYLANIDRVKVFASENTLDYFQAIPDSLDDMCGHAYRYTWQVYLGSTLLAQITNDKDMCDISVDFQGKGFLPEEGVTYTIKCQRMEVLMEKVSHICNGNEIKMAVRYPEGSVALTPENFPDDNLRAYLKDTYDKDNNDILTPAELEQTSQIYTHAYPVKSLEGIKLLPYLTSIYCYGDEGLRSVDCSGMHFLRVLDLRNCSIDELNVTDCPNLTELYLNGICDHTKTDGSLTELNLSGCTSMSKLTIQTSKIQTVDVSECPDLVMAAIHGTETEKQEENYIETRLQDSSESYVRTSWNNQQRLIVAHMSDLPVALKSIDYGKDGFLQAEEAKNVTYIDVEYCGLASMDWLKLFPNLTYLTAIGNTINKADFSWNKKLEDLYIDNNAFASVDVSMLPELINLSIGRNARDLKNLDFSANQKLVNLTLDESGVTSVNLSGLTDLSSVSLSGNHLSSVDFSTNGKLTMITLNNVPTLTSLKLSGLSKLGWLEIINSDLESLDLEDCPALYHLDATGNKLEYLDICQNEKLKNVYQTGILTWGRDYSIGRDWVRYSFQDNNNSLKLDRDVVVFDGTVPLEIVSQPTDYEGRIGETATFSVVANGTDIEYQWQQLQKGFWYDLDLPTAKEATLQIEIRGSNLQNSLRCVLRQGRRVGYTDECRIKVKSSTVVASGLGFPIPGRKAGITKTNLESFAPDQYLVDSYGSMWFHVKESDGAVVSQSMSDISRFVAGEAYFLMLHVVPTNPENPQLPVISALYPLQVCGEIPNSLQSELESNRISDVFCTLSDYQMLDDGSMELYFGLNPENSTDLQTASPVTVKYGQHTITTYPLKELAITATSFEANVAGTQKQYESALQVMVTDPGIFWLDATYISSDGRQATDPDKIWKKASALNGVGFVGLSPDMEYCLDFTLKEDSDWKQWHQNPTYSGYYRFVYTTPSVHEDLLVDGGYAQPEDVGSTYVNHLTDVVITPSFNQSHGEVLTFTLSGTGLKNKEGAAFQQMKLVLILQKENADGTKVTQPAIILTPTSTNVFSYEVNSQIDWNKAYVFLIATDEAEKDPDVSYVSAIKGMQVLTVGFDPNGGSGTPAYMRVATAGQKIILPAANLFTAPGNATFDGWDVEGIIMQPGQQLTVTQDVTVKAVWKGQMFQFTGTSMNLGNSLDMLFLINKTDVTETDCYATITKKNAGKADTVKTFQFSEWYTYGSYYLLQYDKLTAMEMNDKFYVQVFHADGTPASECYEDSVADYALRGFDELPEAEKRLSVDLLFYGAAAQKTFGYDMEHLVSDRMTDAQKAYGTVSVSGENKREDKAYPHYAGTSLDLQSRIQFYLFFNDVPRDGYAKISFTNHNGTKVESTVAGSDYLVASATMSVIVVNELTIPDARKLVTCEVYDKDGNLLDSVTDSIESYVFRGTTGEIDEAVLKFADSAYNYFHPSN